MAVESLVSDFYASSSRHKQQTMWRTIKKVLDRWGLEAFPETHVVSPRGSRQPLRVFVRTRGAGGHPDLSQRAACL